MLLAIDAGNTNTVFALIKDGTILEQWRLSTDDQRTIDEYMVWISQLMMLHGRNPEDVTGTIIASVVPPVVWPLSKLCINYFKSQPMIVGAPDVDLGINVDVKNPQEVGADRLVNAVAADHVYGGPLVVVDFGTATTFDVVGSDGVTLVGSYVLGLTCHSLRFTKPPLNCPELLSQHQQPNI